MSLSKLMIKINLNLTSMPTHPLITTRRLPLYWPESHPISKKSLAFQFPLKLPLNHSQIKLIFNSTLTKSLPTWVQKRSLLSKPRGITPRRGRQESIHLGKTWFSRVSLEKWRNFLWMRSANFATLVLWANWILNSYIKTRLKGFAMNGWG